MQKNGIQRCISSRLRANSSHLLPTTPKLDMNTKKLSFQPIPKNNPNRAGLKQRDRPEKRSVNTDLKIKIILFVDRF